MEMIIVLLIMLMCLGLPLILTVFNIINLFKKKKLVKTTIVTDILTFVLGIGLTVLLYWFFGFQDYQEALHLGGGEVGLHAPIASWSMPTVIAILILGIISYILIRIKKLNLPPIIAVASMSGIFICSVFMIIFIIQISENLKTLMVAYLTLFPINYILCSARAVMEAMKYYKEKNIVHREYENKILNECSKILAVIDKWPILAVIFSVPLSAILICILLLFGQRPDEAIKAFLETSDWTLSKKISPPDVIYDGHYLCTVSLKGHQNIVKPTRMGIRKGEKIIVNRQLCIANAFEDLIHEKTPRFHRLVRYIYDKYGFPISKYIKKAWQADIVYILMKPLEWIFLFTLYLFDRKPENRIATQYIGKKLVITD